MNSVQLGDSTDLIKRIDFSPTLTFLDPPFNQGKDYDCHDDDMPDAEYWGWMRSICQDVYKKTASGGSLYFMQREKNAEQVLRVLRESGWVFQNLIIWKKWTSAAAPSNYRHPKHYQIIAFVSKGEVPTPFHKLRISPPLMPHHKYERPNGMFVTDLWDDIKELTAGYFSSKEVLMVGDVLPPLEQKYSLTNVLVSKEELLRLGVWNKDLIKQFLGKDKVFKAQDVDEIEKSEVFQGAIAKQRFHKQQAPVALLTRIILSSSRVGDWVLDPFAGTGTTGCVARQLKRKSVCMEIDSKNVKCIEKRINETRQEDCILKLREDYKHTEGLDEIWQVAAT